MSSPWRASVLTPVPRGVSRPARPLAGRARAGAGALVAGGARHPRPRHRPAPHRGRHALRRRRRHGDAPRRAGRGAGERRRRPAALCLTPRGRAADPGRRARPGRGAGRGAALRPLRGYRPARHRSPRADGDHHRRLRALRRRVAGDGAAGCLRAPSAGRDGRGRERRGGELFRAGCWNTRITPGPPNGRAGACRTCCFPATTPPSPPGGRNESEAITRERRPDLWAAHQAVMPRDRLPACPARPRDRESRTSHEHHPDSSRPGRSPASPPPARFPTSAPAIRCASR